MMFGKHYMKAETPCSKYRRKEVFKKHRQPEGAAYLKDTKKIGILSYAGEY